MRSKPQKHARAAGNLRYAEQGQLNGASPMPNAVKRALIILLATFGIDVASQLYLLIQTLLTPGANWDTGLATYILFDGVAIFVIYSIYLGRNWARILLAIDLLFVLGIMGIAHWVGKAPLLNFERLGWLWLPKWIARLVALVLLFLPASRMWFTSDHKTERARSIPGTTLPDEGPVTWKKATYISIGVFVLAMTQTAYYEVTDDPARNSAGLLLIGWMGAITNGYIEWFANPLLFYSWFCALHKRYGEAVGSAAMALLLMLSFLRRSQIEWTGDNGSRVEAIRGYGFGYWLWLASAAIIVIAILVPLARHIRLPKRFSV